jgi:hypothetical protein
MRRPGRFLIIIFFLLPALTKGQEPVQETPKVLEKLFSGFSSNISDSVRILLNDSIISVIDSYVQSDTVFKHRFVNLQKLGQITSPDSVLKIITWNMILRESQSRYYCYFIRKKDTGNVNHVYKLIADYSPDSLRVDTVYSKSDWYGALYYDIRPFEKDSSVCWVLLGIDYGNPLISRKIIDVVTFNENDSIVFGSSWFRYRKETRYRDVFEYSSSGMMSLRFVSDSSVVFDHLVPFSPEYENNREYYGPDYSTDAYILKDGFWQLMINVDARNEQ